MNGPVTIIAISRRKAIISSALLLLDKNRPGNTILVVCDKTVTITQGKVTDDRISALNHSTATRLTLFSKIIAPIPVKNEPHKHM